MYYGKYVKHETPLVFRNEKPAAEGIIPEPVSLGGYRFKFNKRIFGGFLCDIEGSGGTPLASGVRVTRFLDNVVRDDSDDTRLTVGLALFGRPVIKIWSFEYYRSSGYRVIDSGAGTDEYSNPYRDSGGEGD